MALDESLGVTLPNIPFGGKPGAAGEAYQKFLKENEPRAQQGRQAKEEIELGKAQVPMQVQAGVAGAKAAGAEETARQIRDMPELAEFKEKVKSRPAFVPTQESAKDIMNLFTLTTVIGFALGGAGKAHAQQALSAMNGMVEGHLKGRDDLYKREKDIYDENMKALDRMIEGLKTEIAQGTELAKLGGTAATEKNTQAAYSKGATSLGELAKKLPLVAFNENFNEIAKNWAKVTEGAQKEEERAATAKAAMDRVIYERTHPTITPEFKEVQVKKADGTTVLGSFNARTGQYVDQNGQPISDAVSATTVAAPGSGTAKSQQTAERVLQQDVGNAKFNLENLYEVGKKTGKLPGASDAFLNNFRGTLISDIARYATYSTIDKGLQGNDALLLNMAYDIASAGTGGRGALSDAKVKAVAAQIPLEGEAESVKRTKWNALVQRVVEANKSLPEDKRIELPKDLVDYFQKGESTSAPKEGDKSTSKSGKPIIYRNGAWHYEGT
jgi:hypothetical protein